MIDFKKWSVRSFHDYLIKALKTMSDDTFIKYVELIPNQIKKLSKANRLYPESKMYSLFNTYELIVLSSPIYEQIYDINDLESFILCRVLEYDEDIVKWLDNKGYKCNTEVVEGYLVIDVRNDNEYSIISHYSYDIPKEFILFHIYSA